MFEKQTPYNIRLLTNYNLNDVILQIRKIYSLKEVENFIEDFVYSLFVND